MNESGDEGTDCMSTCWDYSRAGNFVLNELGEWGVGLESGLCFSVSVSVSVFGYLDEVFGHGLDVSQAMFSR